MNTKKDLKKILDREMGPSSFAMFMRAARTRCDLTQVEMAKQLGISKANLCDIEKGRQLVSPEFAASMARLAGLSEVMAVQWALQDLLKRSGLKMQVRLTPKKRAV